MPIQCEYYALEGLGQLLRNVSLVQQNINSGLRLSGIVMTMFDPRTKLSEQVVQEVKKHFGELVYDVIIPRTVRLSEAPGFGQPITVYDAKSKGAEAYRQLAREVALRPTPEAPMPMFDQIPIAVMAPIDGPAADDGSTPTEVQPEEVASDPLPESSTAMPEAELEPEAAGSEPEPEPPAPEPVVAVPEPELESRVEAPITRAHGTRPPPGEARGRRGRGSVGGGSIATRAEGQAALQPRPTGRVASTSGGRDRRELRHRYPGWAGTTATPG